ncbi:hypothetical protein [Avibacterium paragallinarum]|uniref:hypothetical protein n=1 Tax=Avibacterium paragallinarum TaxID=728 RepID=UPI00021ACE56|nr:hypothetical protein [Avibacterium paragallinarum]QIR10956.1 hypothetical protein HBL79_01030 [Avibacterium paragallinarum]QLD64069.1 hypothetical protein VY92_001150 [Avibacterium paragallinarum]
MEKLNQREIHIKLEASSYNLTTLTVINQKTGDELSEVRKAIEEVKQAINPAPYQPTIQPNSVQKHQPIRETFRLLCRLREQSLAQKRQENHQSLENEPTPAPVSDSAFPKMPLSSQARLDVLAVLDRFAFGEQTYDDLFKLSCELVEIYTQGYSKNSL